MNLKEYFATEGALTVAQLRERVGVKSDAQVRQWKQGYYGRQPSPENCVLIEKATGGKVRRWDLRPTDWHRIWPDLARSKDAPAITEEKVKA